MGRKRVNPADAEKLEPGLYIRSGWYYCRFKVKGEWVYKALGNRKDRAITELRQLKDDAQRTGRGGVRISRETMADLWTDYHKNATLRGKRSLPRDERTWHARLSPEFGDTMISRIEKESVTDYMKERRKVASPATCNREASLLKAMLTYAVDNPKKYGLDRNPLHGLKGFVEDNARKPFLSDADETRLLAACLDTKKKAPKYMHDLVVMALRTGARLGELLALQWNQVDLRHGTMTICDSKNTDPRTVPLADDVALTLKARQEVGTGFVLTVLDEKGEKTRVRQEAATQAFRRISRRLKLPGGAKRQEKTSKPSDSDKKPERPDFLHMHDLRHIAAERLLSAGATIIALQDLLGHRSMILARRYAQSRQTDLAVLVNAAALKGATKPPVEKKS